MNPVTWLVATLSLSLPAEYKLATSSSEQVPHPRLPGTLVHEKWWRWEAPGGRVVMLGYWQPYPPRDGGPMYAVAEWPAVVAGQKVKVYETDFFMGCQQRVLVTSLRFSAPQAQALLYATGLSQAEFTAMLGRTQLRR